MQPQLWRPGRQEVIITNPTRNVPLAKSQGWCTYSPGQTSSEESSDSTTLWTPTWGLSHLHVFSTIPGIARPHKAKAAWLHAPEESVGGRVWANKQATAAWRCDTQDCEENPAAQFGTPKAERIYPLSRQIKDHTVELNRLCKYLQRQNHIGHWIFRRYLHNIINTLKLNSY